MVLEANRDLPHVFLAEDHGFRDVEVFDLQRTIAEKVAADRERNLDEAGTRNDDLVADLVVPQERDDDGIEHGPPLGRVRRYPRSGERVASTARQ